MQIKNKKYSILLIIFTTVVILLYVLNYIKINILISDGVCIKDINYNNSKKIFACYGLEWFDYIKIDEIYYVQYKDYYTVLKYTIPKSNENEYDRVVIKDGWSVEKTKENTFLIDTWDLGENEYIEQDQKEKSQKGSDLLHHILHKSKNQNEIVYYLYSELYSSELEKIIKKIL